ncbi:MAG: hypothetical protein ACKVT1_06710 [Dehalococcoidia bacterium]
MAEITLHHDTQGGTLVIYWGNPDDEDVCDHTDSDVVVMLDASGRAIGIEVLNYEPTDSGPLTVRLDRFDVLSSGPVEVPA